jgi:hypothetical protein
LERLWSPELFISVFCCGRELKKNAAPISGANAKKIINAQVLIVLVIKVLSRGFEA